MRHNNRHRRRTSSMGKKKKRSARSSQASEEMLGFVFTFTLTFQVKDSEQKFSGFIIIRHHLNYPCVQYANANFVQAWHVPKK